jgi:hypothetical protein
VAELSPRDDQGRSREVAPKPTIERKRTTLHNSIKHFWVSLCELAFPNVSKT